eukprot:gene1998-2272_t
MLLRTVHPEAEWKFRHRNKTKHCLHLSSCRPGHALREQRDRPDDSQTWFDLLTIAITFPLTCVPLALATLDGGLRQGSKTSLRNHLIEESDALTTEPAVRAMWLVDGMAALCKKSRQTTDAVAKRYTWKKGLHFQQPAKHAQWKSLANKAWHNSENKTNPIHFLVEFIKENRNLLRNSTIVTENEKSRLLTTKVVIQLDSCNHIEADTRLIYVASTANSPVIIRATDTDVLILMVFVYREMHEQMVSAKEFFGSILYPGLRNENLTETLIEKRRKSDVFHVIKNIASDLKFNMSQMKFDFGMSQNPK